jgi:hypothetical protein
MSLATKCSVVKQMHTQPVGMGLQHHNTTAFTIFPLCNPVYISKESPSWPQNHVSADQFQLPKVKHDDGRSDTIWAVWARFSHIMQLIHNKKKS